MMNQLLITYFLTILVFLSHYGRAQQTLFPAAIPLAVRSPYLSCWDQTANGTTLGTLWPTTSNSNQVRCLPYTGCGKQILYISGARLVRPRAHRRINLCFLGRRSRGKCQPKWYGECHRHGYHPYPNRGRYASWAHAS